MFGHVGGFIARVAPRCIGAPLGHGQHRCDRVPSVAGSGFSIPNGEVNSPLRSLAPRCIGVRFAWNASTMAQARVPVPLTPCSGGLFLPLPGFDPSPSSRRARRFLDAWALVPLPGASTASRHSAVRIPLAWTCLARPFRSQGSVKYHWASKGPLTQRLAVPPSPLRRGL
jgi:hypothetical protein